MSEFRVDKARAAATLTLAGGTTLVGSFFVGAGPTGTATERVVDLLNGEAGFVPFEIVHDGRTQIALYHRAHISIVALTEPGEELRDPGYDSVTRRSVQLRLTTGATLVGTVRVYRPRGSDRLSDWSRSPEPFRYLETDTGTVIVNLAQAIELRELIDL